MMIDALPPARQLLADKGYDADRFRQALAERGIAACSIVGSGGRPNGQVKLNFAPGSSGIRAEL